MHTKVLAILYFVFGYIAAFGMFYDNTFHVKAIGCFLGIYLTYQLTEQLEQ
jgi:hypothetical protein